MASRALVPAGLRQDERVDAGASRMLTRAAGIAGVDGRIGLHESAASQGPPVVPRRTARGSGCCRAIGAAERNTIRPAAPVYRSPAAAGVSGVDQERQVNSVKLTILRRRASQQDSAVAASRRHCRNAVTPGARIHHVRIHQDAALPSRPSGRCCLPATLRCLAGLIPQAMPLTGSAPRSAGLLRRVVNHSSSPGSIGEARSPTAWAFAVAAWEIGDGRRVDTCGSQINRQTVS
jgi:hypothetical protein